MSAPLILSLRCPNCGGPLAAPAPRDTSVAWYSCPHCGAPVPVIAPRDPAPLFSWEVYPHLYPRLGTPESPAQRIPKVGFVILLVLFVFCAGVAGVLAYEGASSLVPSSFEVAGTVVVNGTGPIAGARVMITGENGLNRAVLTNASGGFGFSGVPAGGVLLNASTPGLGYVVYQYFVTPLYSSVAISPTQLTLVLDPNASANNVTALQAPFPDLETFVASLWGAAALVALAAIVLLFGALAVRKGRSPTLAVAGGVGAVFVPIAITETGLGGVFPWGWIVTLVAVGLGALTAVLFVMLMTRVGPSPSS